MPITIVDDDVVLEENPSGLTVYDDDLEVSLMAIKAINEGGTGRDKSVDGPGVCVQASTGANITTLETAIGTFVYGTAGGVPAAFAANNTTTRKFLMQVATIADTPVFSWVQPAATDIASGTLPVARGGLGASLAVTGPGLLYQATAGAAVSVSQHPSLGAIVLTQDVDTPPTIDMRGAEANIIGILLSNEAGSNNWMLAHTIGAGGSQGAFRLYDSGTGINALYVDTLDNVGIGGAASFGTNAAKALALTNGTAPTTSPADSVVLYSTDLSAGNATLGLRTETAVVTESVTSDRTLSVKINGTTYKICLKS